MSSACQSWSWRLPNEVSITRAQGKSVGAHPWMLQNDMFYNDFCIFRIKKSVSKIKNLHFYMCFFNVLASCHVLFFSWISNTLICRPLLGSSPPFSASSKMSKTLGPFGQNVLGPPAGARKGPTCSFYCVLQYKIGIGLKRPRLF